MQRRAESYRFLRLFSVLCLRRCAGRIVLDFLSADRVSCEFSSEFPLVSCDVAGLPLVVQAGP